MEALSNIITKDYLAKLEILNLALNTKIKQGYQGMRKSSAKGSSVEFSDFRQYSLGDDIKNIDWNSYARFDKLFIKVFMEERQGTFNIFIDTSNSMDFGESNKGLYSKVLAASISYICLKNSDKLNIFSCKDKLHSVKNKVSSRLRFYEVVEFLDSLDYSGETNIDNSIRDSEKYNISNGSSIILSDFFTSTGYQKSVDILQSKNNDVSLIQILSDEEINPIFEGRLRMIDSEDNTYKDILINDTIISEYKGLLKNFNKDMKDFCNKRGIGYAVANTKKNHLDVLNKLLTR